MIYDVKMFFSVAKISRFTWTKCVIFNNDV